MAQSEAQDAVRERSRPRYDELSYTHCSDENELAFRDVEQAENKPRRMKNGCATEDAMEYGHYYVWSIQLY